MCINKFWKVDRYNDKLGIWMIIIIWGVWYVMVVISIFVEINEVEGNLGL